MRTKRDTFDAIRLKRKAEAAVASGIHAVERWWSSKYNIPANHELFQKQKPAALVLEMLEDLHQRRDDLRDELKHTKDLITRAKVSAQLAEIDRLLSHGKALKDKLVLTGDPLVDEWERDLYEGRMPNLAKGLSPDSPLLQKPDKIRSRK